jgi:acyl carrier protein
MFDTVKKILVDDLQIDADDISMDAELINDLGINSLELADLILLCEEKFGIQIQDDDIHKFISVGDVVNYLNENVDGVDEDNY